MKIQVGLWIDHRQAVIVRLFEQGEEVKLLPSNLPKNVRFSGTGHNQAEPHDDFAEDTRENRYQNLRNHYYDEVIAELANAETIFIMGPGEAKQELQKRLEKDILASHVEALETADRLTEKQIVAHVKAHFQAPELNKVK